jgi:pimeloyl-ACP methyl ester carboxylesterase
VGAAAPGSAASGAVDLYFESAGRGPAVLLVMGFGMDLSGWWRTVPVLARRFRVLAFDNRGVGRSEASPWPYLVTQLADDAVAVLDAAGERRAHVYGLSLGGMVAQEIALRHPDRVRALVLGATSPGGTAAVAGDPGALSFFSRLPAMGDEEAHWAATPYLYGERTRRRRAQRIADDVARRTGGASSLLTHAQQLAAAGSHDAADRLERIAAPTLVVHGEHDVLVPSANARALAAGIPGAELRVWPAAGHFYVTDEPRADREVARFLDRHSPGRSILRGLPARARRLIAAATQVLAV